MDKPVRFKLNGKEVTVETAPERMLLWVLRTDLAHTGAKYGCGEGYCGFCTVLVDGRPELSCQFPLAKAEGRSVLTIEGLAAADGRLHPLQQAFIDHGAMQCGFCTVLVDGKPMLACQFPLAKAEGRSVLTIEGLVQGGRLHPLQQAFIDHGAMQCGYCTPGMILRAYALLRQDPDPSEADIADALEGNLCRCNNYRRIIAAVRAASQALRMRVVDHEAR